MRDDRKTCPLHCGADGEQRQVAPARAAQAAGAAPSAMQKALPLRFSRRELEVLRLLARGYTYKEIAERLFISVKTVETHASNILRKTQTSNRHQLTRWAVARDLG